MLTSVRSLLAATMLAGCALAATPAFAEDEPAKKSDFLTGVSSARAGVVASAQPASMVAAVRLRTDVSMGNFLNCG